MLRILLSLLLWVVGTAAVVAQPACNGTLSDNSLSGGDFGAGATPVLFTDPELAPGYQYQSQPPPEDGFYTIASTTDFGSASFDCWIEIGDNSSDPNGYMMIVNADFSPGIFFETVVPVCENTSYLFQADLINLIRTDCTDAIFPNVDFLIDGVVHFQTGDLPQDETWHTQGFSFTTASGQNELVLSLRNNAAGGGGNDLAIDNIAFYHCGPPAVLPAVTSLCGGGHTTLIAQVLGMNYTDPHYRWQVSTDNGTTWIDIADSDSDALYLEMPTAGHRYRFLLADGTANLEQAICRTTSNATLINFSAPPEYFQSVFLCTGDTLLVGQTALTQAGQHQTTVTHTNGCDSIIHTFIALLPAYEQLFTQTLCPGDLFMDQLYERDTTLIYYYTASSGCDSTVHFEIDVFDFPGNSGVDTITVCPGESTILEAPMGYPLYVWSTGENTASITTSEGNYTVQITNANGCTIERSFVVLRSNPFAEIATQDPTCPDRSDGALEVLFSGGGTGPYAFGIENLYPFSSDTILSGLAAGDFTLLVQDAMGCVARQDFSLLAAEPISANLQGLPADAVYMGDSLFLQLSTNGVPVQIEWQADGYLSCRDCAHPVWLPLGEGQISYTLTTTTGCTWTETHQIRLLEPYRVYFPTAFSPNGDQINDHFAPGLSSQVQRVVQWEIYDRWGGQILSEHNLVPGDTALRWDGRGRGQMLNTGVYFYRANILFEDGQSQDFVGTVTLLR